MGKKKTITIYGEFEEGKKYILTLDEKNATAMEVYIPTKEEIDKKRLDNNLKFKKKYRRDYINALKKRDRKSAKYKCIEYMFIFNFGKEEAEKLKKEIKMVKKK